MSNVQQYLLTVSVDKAKALEITKSTAGGK